MAMYSVFDFDSQRYDYYTAKGPNLGERAPIRARGLAGVAPEHVMPKLPVNALYAGSGQDPRGILAVQEFGYYGEEAGTVDNQPFAVKYPGLAAAIAVGAVIALYKLTIHFVK